MNWIGIPRVRFVALAVSLLVIGAAIAATVTPSSGEISPLQTVLRGQTQWLAGGPASLRVIVSNHDTGAPASGTVRVSLTPTDQQATGARLLYSGALRRGTAEATFRVPDVKPGTYELQVGVTSPLGTDLLKQSVTVRHETRLLLTTDKPLYQPGQTIHIRALALQRPTSSPARGQTITLEVEDAKGNKVFKEPKTASDYGVVSADFTLADELNMGRYTIRAVNQYGSSERTVEVKRYVLPKFKVTATTDKSYYLAGQRITGTVQADYFFGKPTSGSNVLITLSTFDVQFKEFAEIKGKTDENGTFAFEADLPSYFVGLPLEKGNAFVKMDVEVTDRAEHTERITNTVPVAQDPVIVTVVPESGEIRPGLDNTIYVLLSRPDGSPLAATFSAYSLSPEEVREYRRGGMPPSRPAGVWQTDAMGMKELTVSKDVATGGVAALLIQVQKPERLPARVVEIAQSSEKGGIILRADRALLKVGQTVGLSVISTKQRGTTYVDVIRDGQTILTKSVEVSRGHGEFSLPLTHDLQGTLQVHAYQILPDENIIRDTRLLYVAPADDLVVEVRPDQESYRPGGTANLRFVVRDQKGKPTQAALGLTIVDESVFALQEMQPGLERIYFALEKELLQPRYEIHGFTGEGIVSGKLPFEPAAPVQDEALRQRAAKVLFAATQPSDPYTLNVNSYDEKLEKAMDGWVKQMAAAAEKIDRALKGYYTAHREWLKPEDDLSILVHEGLLKKTDLRDRWGTLYRVHWWVSGSQRTGTAANCNLDSAGPDRTWDTKDDIRGIGAWAKDGMPAWRRRGGKMRGGIAGGAVEELAMFDAVAAKGVAPATAPASRSTAQPGQPQVRLRQFFPETMYVNPSLITDERGQANVSVEMADSITTWRLQALASSQKGQLGSATKGLRVFQDFFIDIDLPVALTQGDEVAIPVAVYNYLPTRQTVKLQLEMQPWFELRKDEAQKTLDIGPSDITVVYYRIRAEKIGNHSLTVHAQGSKLSDAIKRQIEVMPNGEERRDTWNDVLEGTVEKQVTIPKEAIADASTILVKIYPGLLSQAVEGLDSMLRMPFGCFEQTSSVTYPNVLVMDYMKTTKQIKPEIQMKAEQYINVGYQRLLSFEVPGGGFSWFGDAPAHKVLTAYGLLEFHDMSRVHEVDPAVITRTQNWLAGLQQKDGTWTKDEGGIAEGIINRQTDTLRTTGYIAWALAESGYKGEASVRAVEYLTSHWTEAKDPYALAVIANAFLSAQPDSQTGASVVDALAKLAVVDDKTAYWKTTQPTFTSAQDKSADLETTALATYALVKSGRHIDLTNKAIAYLIRSKDSYGTWNTTQATVWALKALLLSLQKAAQQIDATVTVEVNGTQAGSFRISQADYEVVRQVDAKGLIHEGANDVKIALNGKGTALYQIVSKYYIPWELVRRPAEELLSISVSYDRASLATDDILRAKVRVVNNAPKDAEMVVVDLGVPPGFDVLTEDFQEMVGQKMIKKYTVAARQIIVYLDKLASRAPLELTYRLRAKTPIKAVTPASTVYRYYNPEIKATAAPVELEVRG